MTAPPTRPAARPAADVAKPLGLSETAIALLTPTLAPRPYLDALLAAELWDDAVRFLAAALPKREAVFWACTCLREAPRKPLPPAEEDALKAAEAWVRAGTEPARRAAGAAAEAAGYGTAGGAAAAAAFWSGGSLAPPHVAPVPPADGLTAKGVAGALFLALAADPLAAAATRRRFLDAGGRIAAGELRPDGALK